MVNSRRKGKTGELELSHLLRAHGFPGARRGQQRSGLDQADVIGGPEGWHIECKRVQRLNFMEAFNQALRDCAGKRKPAVVARRNNGPWVVLLRLEDWLELIQTIDALT